MAEETSQQQEPQGEPKGGAPRTRGDDPGKLGVGD